MSSKHLFKGFLIPLELTSQQAFCHTRVFCLPRPPPFLPLWNQVYDSRCKQSHFCRNVSRVPRVGQLEVPGEVRRYGCPSGESGGSTNPLPGDRQGRESRAREPPRARVSSDDRVSSPQTARCCRGTISPWYLCPAPPPGANSDPSAPRLVPAAALPPSARTGERGPRRPRAERADAGDRTENVARPCVATRPAAPGATQHVPSPRCRGEERPVKDTGPKPPWRETAEVSPAFLSQAAKGTTR